MNELVHDEAVETLAYLGLKHSQARVYLALVENGLSTAKEISEYSGVNRQEIYRIMPKLEEGCLVERIIGIPTRWRATPLRDGLSILMENREKETSELQTKAEKIINHIRENNERVGLQEEVCRFVMMPGKEAHLKWLENRFKDLQKTLDVIITWSDEKVIRYYCNKEIKEQVKRGAKTRLIIYVPEKEKPTYENDQTFKNNPNYQKVLVFNPPLVLGGVFDRKELILATQQDNPVQRSANFFYSNSPTLVALFQNYFEQLWKTAYENINEEH